MVKLKNLSLMGLQSGSFYESRKIIEAMEDWRNEDHEDSLVLTRHQVIVLLENVK